MRTPVTDEPPAGAEQPAAYFDLQASWGFTKHLGGTAATDALLAGCAVGPDSRVLEVGCGVGVSPCHAAQRRGCRVVAVDLSSAMLGWAARRVRRLGLGEQISLAAADAMRLPFPDGSFDAVICESVLAFVPDRARALAEFARLARPGGYVGVTEGCWLRPPPPALEEYLARALGGARFLPADDWAALLRGAGLSVVAAEPRRVSALDQWRGDLGRLDASDLADYARAWRSMIGGLATSPAFRRYLRTLWPSSPSVLRLFASFGYGIFVGRKAAPDGAAQRPGRAQRRRPSPLDR